MSLYLGEDEIDRLIAEDVSGGDLTSRVLGLHGQKARITFSARRSLILCAADVAARIIQKLGGTVGQVPPDGCEADPGTLLLEATGPAASLHAAWKVAQTTMEWCSGIATAAHRIRLAAESASSDVRIACARKAPPGTRKLAIKAVLAGGAEMHRQGLAETILIFPEHLALLPGVSIGSAVALALRQAPERKVVVEVTDRASALEAADAGAHVIQCEKFSPADVAQVVQWVGERSLVAAAGGVNASNAAEYAAAGAKILVTSAPYSGLPAEIQVVVTPA